MRQKAEFKLFNGGATLFGEAAAIAAEELRYEVGRGKNGKVVGVTPPDGIEDDAVKVGFTRTGDLYIKVPQQDIAPLSKVFEEKGWEVALTKPK